MKDTSRRAEEIARRVIVPPGSVDEGVHDEPGAGGHDTRLKKIYIYADNIFTPQGLTDFRTVRVQTPAFDLTGWIDFTQAQPQDEFQTEIRVWMAHASGVLLQTTMFSAGTLAYMQQMAGTNYISGNHIEVKIEQTHSGDNFATKVPIAYQFIVESR